MASDTSASPILLIGDIGGTNARFAIASNDTPGYADAATLKCDDFASVELAIAQYLEDIGCGSPDIVCLAAAGPLIGDAIKMTNNHWNIRPDDLRQEFGTDRVRLLNDFEAVSYSIPFLGDDEHHSVGLPEAGPLPRDFNLAIIGPGTGLGTAGLYRRDDRLIPISGEGGHTGFAPASKVQIEILGVLRDRFERVSGERMVSGSGIENIYTALCVLHDEKRPHMSAAEIFEHAADDPRAGEAVQMFFDVLGQIAGDLALTLDARDGVYIAGGICKRYPDLLQNSGFRNAFENKGRHRSLLELIPTQLITHNEPGLLGAAYCALSMSAASATSS